MSVELSREELEKYLHYMIRKFGIEDHHSNMSGMTLMPDSPILDNYELFAVRFNTTDAVFIGSKVKKEFQ